MATTRRVADVAADRARRQLVETGRELRQARQDRGLSTRAVARAVGMSSATVSRVERALLRKVSVRDLALLHAAVGLELSVRSYPGGQPIRDAGQVRLLEAFRALVHTSLRWRTEVPLGRPGDQRAWDATLTAPGRFRYGVEGESSPRDLQALLRRLNLKRQDDQIAGVLLVVPDSRQVRAFLAAGRELLDAEFPVAGSTALALLAAGKDPGGSAIIVVPGAFVRAARPRGPGRARG